MKKILSVFLVALLLIGMLPMNALHTHAATAQYVKVTQNLSDWSGRYLIVYESANKAMNGGLALAKIDADNNTIGVTISNNAIEANATTTAAEFTIASDGSGKYTIKSSQNGYYIGRTGSSNGMDENASTAHKHTISHNGTNVVITSSGGPTLQVYQSGSNYRFRYYKTSQKAIALYKLEESCAHSNTTTSTTPATCTENGKTVVTCNDCSEQVSETVIPATGHSYVDGVCQNCSNALAVVSFQVPSQVAAVGSIAADENTGKVTLPAAADYTGKYAYTFAGWAAASVSETEQAPTLYTANSQYTPDGNTTLYAVYTRTEGSGGAEEYVLTDLADISDADVVVIVGNNGSYYAMSNDNGTSAPSAVSVTVSGNKITGTVNENIKWNIVKSGSNFTVYPNGSTATWLYNTAANNGVKVGTGANKEFTIGADDYIQNTTTNRYLGIYNKQDWRSYTTGKSHSNIGNQTFGFYVLTAGGTTYYTSILENEDTTCQHTSTTETTADATCTDAGSVTVTCDACGAQISIAEIPAKGHTEVIDEAVAPTCVDAGLTEGKHCSVCNAVIVAQEEISATGEHSYDASGVCGVCGATTVIVEIPEIPESGVYQLVTDLEEIKEGGQFVVVADGVALGKTMTNGKLNAVPVDIINNLVYTLDAPTWIVGKYGESIVFVDGEQYLKHSSSTNLSTVKDPFAWNLVAADDGFYIVSSSDDTRGLAYRAGSSAVFGAYALSNIESNNTEYNFSIKFYKLVEGELVLEQSTLSFIENSVSTISQEVNVGSSYTMPAPANAAPEGYTFAGWVAETVEETAVAPVTVYETGAEYTVGTDVTFYALYTRIEETESDEGGVYKPIEDISTLAAGQKVIIANIDLTHALSTTQNSNNRSAVAIAMTDGMLVPEEGVQILTLESGTIEGTFAFCVSEGKYLAAGTSTANRLYTQAMSDAACFTVTVTDGVYSVVSHTSSERNQLKYNYNGGTPIFACYGSGQTDVVLLGETSGTTQVTYYTTHVHTVVIDEAVAADCLNTGLTEGKHCSVCDAVLVPQQEIAALGHNEVTNAAVEPDCVNTGLTEGSHCDRCGEVLNAQDEIPALGHKYEGTVAPNENNVPVLTHTCSACGDSYSIELKFSAADLTLQNSLIIGFKTLTDIAGEDGFTNVRATFQYGSRETMTVNLAEASLQSDKYAFPCRYITPSQIGDTVYATLYGTYNGVEYSYQMEYGVSQYCYNMLAKENSSDDLKDLMVDMLYYCDAARAYTNYKPTESVTAGLGDYAAYGAADRTYSTVLNARYETIDNPTASWKAASLVMYHATRMQLRFAVAEGVDISKVTAKVLVGTEEKTGYIVTSDDYAGQYLVIIDDIAARQLSDVVYVTLYEGDTAISNTISYSVESYACAKQNDKNAKLVNLVNALMHYGDSAREFLG